MPTLTKTVTTDAGESIVLTRATDDQGEANALCMQGWTPQPAAPSPAPGDAGKPTPSPKTK